MAQARRVLEGRTMYTERLPVNVNRVEESFYLEQHTHDFVEFIYVEEGVGFHYIEDELVRVRRGDVFCLPVGASHVFRPTGRPPSPQLVVYNCVVDPQFLRQLCEMHELELPFDPVTGRPAGGEGAAGWYAFSDQAEQIGGTFRSLYAEYAAQGPGSKAAISAWLLLLLVRLFRRHGAPAAGNGAAGGRTGGGPGAGTDESVEAALEWLERNLDGDVTLARTAAVAGMSPRHFYRLFKKRTGHTFLEYVRSQRIGRSCVLLETTGLSVTEIADAAGYRDMKSFLRAFRKLTGATPREYRRTRAGGGGDAGGGRPSP